MALRPLRLLDNQRPSLSINRELKNIRLNFSPFFFFYRLHKKIERKIDQHFTFNAFNCATIINQSQFLDDQTWNASQRSAVMGFHRLKISSFGFYRAEIKASSRSVSRDKCTGAKCFFRDRQSLKYFHSN